MATSQSEFGAKLKKILHIYVLAQEAYLYTEYFYNPNTEDEKNLIYNTPHSGHLRFIRHLMFRVLITEISKLFKASKQEKYNIITFIQSLTPSGHFRKLGVANHYIQKWNKCIDENKEVISKVLTLRDKVYAHADDPLKNYSDVSLTFESIKALLDLTAEILKELYRVILNTELLLDSPRFTREKFMILSLLAKAEKHRVDDINKTYFFNKN